MPSSSSASTWRRPPEVVAARTRRLNDLDLVFERVPFDVECTRSYGLIAARAAARDATVRSKDAPIAAQAHRHGAAVLIANLDDFRPFAHLVEVLGPRRRTSDEG